MEVVLLVNNLVMMVESEEALQYNLQELNDVLKKWEIKAKWQKTKVDDWEKRSGM